MVSHAKKCIKAELKQAVLDERFQDTAEMKEAIREMSRDAGAVSKTYYFPLAGSMWSEEYGEYVEMDESYIAEHAGEIGEYFAVCSACDMESRGAYYKGAGADKLLLADWGFIDLEVVDVRLTEPMTKEEEKELRDWIRGQNSDGLGEGFEQWEIPTGRGNLYVSFWDSGKDYFIKDDEEMDEYLEHIGQQFGGM